MATKADRRRATDDLLPDERCPVYLVNDLVKLGFNEKDVERWTAAKARSKLNKYKRDNANAASRADGVALRQDGVTYPPPQAERDEAAAWIAAAMAQADGWELRLAMEHGMRLLADDEAVRLATHLIQRLKIRPPLPESPSLLNRVTTRRPAESGPTDDGEVVPL